jgi:hypothetical protein
MRCMRHAPCFDMEVKGWRLEAGASRSKVARRAAGLSGRSVVSIGTVRAAPLGEDGLELDLFWGMGLSSVMHGCGAAGALCRCCCCRGCGARVGGRNRGLGVWLLAVVARVGVGVDHAKRTSQVGRVPQG